MTNIFPAQRSFSLSAAKMNNAPVPYMIAAAFKNEDRASSVRRTELSRLTQSKS